MAIQIIEKTRLTATNACLISIDYISTHAFTRHTEILYLAARATLRHYVTICAIFRHLIDGEAMETNIHWMSPHAHHDRFRYMTIL